MPAARVTFLALFVLLFAAAWSNDTGLQAAPAPAPILRHEGPSAEPNEARPRMADGHWKTSHSAVLPRKIHRPA